MNRIARLMAAAALCCAASLPADSRLDGLDISKVFSGEDLPERKYIASEWYTEWGYTISPGRMIRSGSKEATEAPDLLMIAKYLERMGDHAASLARWVLNAADPNSDWINNPPQVD